MRKRYRIVSMVLALVLALSMVTVVDAATKIELDAAVEKSAAFMLKTVDKPAVGTIGGEWAILGLARYGVDVPEGYYEKYYTDVESYVVEKKG